MGQYSENGCRLASDAAKKRHNNKPVEYCRKHCFESSCIGCVLSGQPKKEMKTCQEVSEEVENMPSGLKECPKCGEQNGSKSKECSECGYDFTTPQGYDGPGSDNQPLEEKPEEPITKCHECGRVLDPKKNEDGAEKVLCLDCFVKRNDEVIEDEKKQAEKPEIKKPEPEPVKESVPEKAPDTKTKPKPLFSIEFEDDAGYETVRKACDALVGVGFSCTLNRDGWFDFRK